MVDILEVYLSLTPLLVVRALLDVVVWVGLGLGLESLNSFLGVPPALLD